MNEHWIDPTLQAWLAWGAIMFLVYCVYRDQTKSEKRK